MQMTIQSRTGTGKSTPEKNPGKRRHHLDRLV